jgi:hypothetical protein
MGGPVWCRLAAPVAALAFGVAACGGDDGDAPLSGAALGRAASTVCAQNHASDPATDTIVPFDTIAELRQPYAADERRAQATFDALNALDAADSASPALKQLADSIGRIATLDAVIGSAKSMADFTRDAPRVIDAYQVAFEQARKLGAKACPPKAESPAYLVAEKRSGGTTAAAGATTSTGTTSTQTTEPDASGGTAADDTSVLGTWRDVVTQYGPGSQRDRYTAEITVSSVTIGERAGTSSYPRFGCEGVLTVSSANADGSVATFREDIVKGRKRCYDVDARIRLERPVRGGHFVSFRWRGRTTQGTRVEVLGDLGEVGVPG